MFPNFATMEIYYIIFTKVAIIGNILYTFLQSCNHWNILYTRFQTLKLWKYIIYMFPNFATMEIYYIIFTKVAIIGNILYTFSKVAIIGNILYTFFQTSLRVQLWKYIIYMFPNFTIYIYSCKNINIVYT